MLRDYEDFQFEYSCRPQRLLREDNVFAGVCLSTKIKVKLFFKLFQLQKVPLPKIMGVKSDQISDKIRNSFHDNGFKSLESNGVIDQI